MNPLLELQTHKQSVWLDYIRRDLIVGGGLRALVEQDGLRGVTSNPTIFEKAIEGDTDYDQGIAELLARNADAPVGELYDALATEDVRHAADILRSIYEEVDGLDVLSVSAEALAVASLGDSGWSGLSDPRRFIATLQERGIKNPWVKSGTCKQCGLTLGTC